MLAATSAVADSLSSPPLGKPTVKNTSKKKKKKSSSQLSSCGLESFFCAGSGESNLTTTAGSSHNRQSQPQHPQRHHRPGQELTKRRSHNAGLMMFMNEEKQRPLSRRSSSSSSTTGSTSKSNSNSNSNSNVRNNNNNNNNQSSSSLKPVRDHGSAATENESLFVASAKQAKTKPEDSVPMQSSVIVKSSSPAPSPASFSASSTALLASRASSSSDSPPKSHLSPYRSTSPAITAAQESEVTKAAPTHETPPQAKDEGEQEENEKRKDKTKQEEVAPLLTLSSSSNYFDSSSSNSNYSTSSSCTDNPRRHRRQKRNRQLLSFPAKGDEHSEVNQDYSDDDCRTYSSSSSSSSSSSAASSSTSFSPSSSSRELHNHKSSIDNESKNHQLHHQRRSGRKRRRTLVGPSSNNKSRHDISSRRRRKVNDTTIGSVLERIGCQSMDATKKQKQSEVLEAATHSKRRNDSTYGSIHSSSKTKTTTAVDPDVDPDPDPDPDDSYAQPVHTREIPSSPLNDTTIWSTFERIGEMDSAKKQKKAEEQKVNEFSKRRNESTSELLQSSKRIRTSTTTTADPYAQPVHTREMPSSPESTFHSHLISPCSLSKNTRSRAMSFNDITHDNIYPDAYHLESDRLDSGGHLNRSRVSYVPYSTSPPLAQQRLPDERGWCPLSSANAAVLPVPGAANIADRTSVASSPRLAYQEQNPHPYPYASRINATTPTIMNYSSYKNSPSFPVHNVNKNSNSYVSSYLACGYCPNCLRDEDCGTCLHCLQARNFVGLSLLKPKCICRVCTHPILQPAKAKGQPPPHSPVAQSHSVQQAKTAAYAPPQSHAATSARTLQRNIPPLPRPEEMRRRRRIVMMNDEVESLNSEADSFDEGHLSDLY